MSERVAKSAKELHFGPNSRFSAFGLRLPCCYMAIFDNAIKIYKTCLQTGANSGDDVPLRVGDGRSISTVDSRLVDKDSNIDPSLYGRLLINLSKVYKKIEGKNCTRKVTLDSNSKQDLCIPYCHAIQGSDHLDSGPLSKNTNESKHASL